ncbi:DUF1793-domain-containing protein [Poronia punctata]|nr:DUF1793-domain-containing protein [Poronia punctata]
MDLRSWFMSILSCLAVIATFLQDGMAQGLFYSPLRPPSVPLAVRNPYVNVWSTAANGETLNSATPKLWTGESVGWEGIVVVDGVAYEYLGSTNRELPESSQYSSAEPLKVVFDSQASNFTFQAGPVTILASFFSPVTPRDVCRSSIPLSYLTTTVNSNDGQPHHIQFYSDIASTWLGLGSQDDITWALRKNSAAVNETGHNTSTPEDLFTWFHYRHDNVVFGENREYPLWGNVTYTTAPSNAGSFSFECGEATAVRMSFYNNRTLSNDVAGFTTNFGDHTPVFAFAHDFGNVSEASVRYTVGSIQDPIVQYITNDGLDRLSPWWRKCYDNLDTMIRFHWHDYYDVKSIGDYFEMQLQEDVDSFYRNTEAPVRSDTPFGSTLIPDNGTDQYGQDFVFQSWSNSGFLNPTNWTGIAVPFVSEAQSYYSIVALSARQVMGAYVFAQDPNATNIEPLIFQKEISSNGNVNTVDVLYPAMPFFLYANPNLLRYALQPLYDYQEGQFYPNGYCIHDLGARFPNATGHVEGMDEYMPVEESANFILMSYAYYKFTGDSEWLISHYDLLRQFSQYLIEFALIPETQLSTDDFAGTLANQTNLAIKGIVGLQAMSYIASLAGADDAAVTYSTTAADYYATWKTLAAAPGGQHMTLAYQWRSSWGLLYNIYPDKLLNMGLVDASIYEMQSSWYPTVSQAFGVALDNRHAYAKSDWQIWAAATSHNSTRRLLVNGIAYWLNHTVSDGPFSDLYQCTGRGEYPPGITFRARPVVGGHFAFLALGKTGQDVSAEGADAGHCLFPQNSTEPLPITVVPVPSPAGGILTDEQKKAFGGRITTVLSNAWTV